VEAEALLDTLASMEVELEAETLGTTLGYVEFEALVDTPPDTCRGGNRDCWREPNEVKAKALVHRQADTIR